jgi:S-phase kinase-associated protein 1
MADDDLVTLVSQDGQEFKIEVKVAKMSETIRQLMLDAGTKDPIPIPNIDGATLAKVLEYCKYHTEHPDLPDDTEEKSSKIDLSKRREIKNPWDREFCKLDVPTIENLIIAANYLDIKGLLEVSCKTIATALNGQTVEKMREILGIKSDWTPEEEERIKKENAWVED